MARSYRIMVGLHQHEIEDVLEGCGLLEPDGAYRPVLNRVQSIHRIEMASQPIDVLELGNDFVELGWPMSIVTSAEYALRHPRGVAPSSCAELV